MPGPSCWTKVLGPRSNIFFYFQLLYSAYHALILPVSREKPLELIHGMVPSGDPDVTCLTEWMPVYIVDDDESMRKALQRLLRSAGYEALTFTSAEDFLDAASYRGRGCLILDIFLPGISGP